MRAGHHCTHLLYSELGVASGARLSTHFHNMPEECRRRFCVRVAFAI